MPEKIPEPLSNEQMVPAPLDEQGLLNLWDKYNETLSRIQQLRGDLANPALSASQSKEYSSELFNLEQTKMPILVGYLEQQNQEIPRDEKGQLRPRMRVVGPSEPTPRKAAL